MAPVVRVQRVESRTSPMWLGVRASVVDGAGKPLVGANVDLTIAVYYLGTGGEHKFSNVKTGADGTAQVDLPHRGPGTTYRVTAKVQHPTDGSETLTTPVEGGV